MSAVRAARGSRGASEEPALLAALRPLIAEVVREELKKLAPTEPRPYVSTRAAAELADVAEGTIRRWIREGRLSKRRAGRRLRVQRSELEQLLRGTGMPRRQHRDDDLSPEDLARRDFG